MSPQVQRNQSARYLYQELERRYPDLDQRWLREQINAIALEELRLIRRDLVNEMQHAGHYHAGRVDVENAVVSGKNILRHIDARIEGKR